MAYFCINVQDPLYNIQRDEKLLLSSVHADTYTIKNKDTKKWFSHPFWVPQRTF